MNARHLRTLRVLFACALAGAAPLLGQSKTAKKGAPTTPAAPAPPPKVQIAVESVLDRRTTSDFPRPGLTVTLSLAGEDSSAVASARPRVTRAVDDTGRSLAEAGGSAIQGTDGWQQARGESGPPQPRLELGSPARKAKTLTALEGVIEVYLPSRDPAGTVKIDQVLTKKDKPLTVPALASQKIGVQVLSKAGLESEKKQAQEKNKAQAAKKKGAKKSDPPEGLEALADALVKTIEMLFMSAGENDLILKVDDPGKKIFSFDLAASDGKPIRSYGAMDLEGYRIVRMLEPIPEGAALLVRLKTARSFGEVPFSLASVKLP